MVLDVKKLQEQVKVIKKKKKVVKLKKFSISQKKLKRRLSFKSGKKKPQATIKLRPNTNSEEIIKEELEMEKQQFFGRTSII